MEYTLSKEILSQIKGEKMLKFKKQIVAIEELAKLLQVDRNMVHALLRKETHPLPLPRKSSPFDPWVFNGLFLTQLDTWVREETMHRATRSWLDAPRVQVEIARAKNNLAEYDFEGRFPPGYFLG